jgi:hypothetical protein
MSSVDWQTTLSAVLGSSVAVAAIGYLAKLTIERSLDVRIEKIRNQNKAELQEQFRRHALIWNSQYAAAKTLLSLVYRFRNSFQELLVLTDESPEAKRSQGEIFERLRAYGNGIVEILYEDRAILPRPLFMAAHELKSPVAALTALGHRYLSDTGPWSRVSEEKLYQRIDALCSIVVLIVHDMTGVDKVNISGASSQMKLGASSDDAHGLTQDETGQADDES